VNREIRKVYRRLSALWLLRYHEKDLAALGGTEGQIQGAFLVRERRIFVSYTPFYISQAIIGLYAVALVYVLVRRPGRFLPYTPSSIAAVIGTFAGSTAVQDFRGTSTMSRQYLQTYADSLGRKYVYGKFIADRGQARVGIEKAPLGTAIHL
jgi:hypothetical protein